MRHLLLCVLATGCTQPKAPPAAKETQRLPNVTFETVDAPSDGGTTDTGYWPTFLRDPQGGLHIAYCDASLGDAKLAHEKPGGAWEVETVDAKGAVGKYISGDWGADGPELVYLDQTKKTLRYAWKAKDGWKFQNLGSDNEDIGISGRFRIGPSGERTYVYYNTRNELLLAVGRKGEGGLVWETNKVAHAGVVHTITLDTGFLPDGKLVLAYPDWAVSFSTLYTATITDLAATKTAPVPTKVDDKNVAGLKTQLVAHGSMFDIVYMSSRGGSLFLAQKDGEGWTRTQLTTNIANVAATTLPGDKLIVALQVGRSDGLGEGAVHLGERDAQGQWSEFLIDDARPVGQYLAIAPTKNGGRAAIAYYDGVKKGLKVARIP